MDTQLSITHRDGKSYINRKDLALMLNVTVHQLMAYEKPNNYSKPLKRSDNDFDVIHYDLLYALQWHSENISHKNRPQADGFSGVAVVEDSHYDGANITAENAKIAKEIESAKNERNKRIQSDLEIQITTKDYIPVDKADKLMAELGKIVIMELHNMMEIQPVKVVECNTVDEVKKVLDNEYASLVNTVRAWVEQVS